MVKIVVDVGDLMADEGMLVFIFVVIVEEVILVRSAIVRGYVEFG